MKGIILLSFVGFGDILISQTLKGRSNMYYYYALIIISVLMFGGGFALQDVYRKMRGSNLKISMESACIGSLAGLIVLLIINGFDFELTGFTFIMALCTALNGMLFSFFAFRALDVINLSLFSLFSMLGGMLIPFLQGIIFYGEKITLAKILCVLFICIALALTLDRGEKKKGFIYYAGVFVLNGMAGVITKLYNELPFVKASAAGYSVWCAVTTAVLSGAVWLVLLLKQMENRPLTLSAGGVSAVCGAINKVANFLLVIALMHVEASVQYPMVTGGVMIVSTAICFLGDRKPSKKELCSVVLAFAAMLLLFVIPI